MAPFYNGRCGFLLPFLICIVGNSASGAFLPLHKSTVLLSGWAFVNFPSSGWVSSWHLIWKGNLLGFFCHLLCSASSVISALISRTNESTTLEFEMSAWDAAVMVAQSLASGKASISCPFYEVRCVLRVVSALRFLVLWSGWGGEGGVPLGDKIEGWQRKTGIVHAWLKSLTKKPIFFGQSPPV